MHKDWVQLKPLTSLKNIIGSKLHYEALDEGKLTREIENKFLTEIKAKGSKRAANQRKMLDRILIYRDKDVAPVGGKDLILVSKDTGRIIDGSADQMLFVDTITNKNKVLDLKMSAPVIKKVYDYTRPYGLIDDYGVQDMSEGFYSYFNLFEKLDLSTIEDTELPKFIVDFYHKLIPDENHRRWTYSWMLDASNSTAQTMLLLVGDMGTGKSTLMSFAASFFRHEQVISEDESMARTQFNSALRGKRLIKLDEIEFSDRKSKSFLKRFFDPKKKIESKGIDAVEENVYVSLIGATNNFSSFYLEPRDRRVFVPDTSQSRLDHNVAKHVAPLAKRIGEGKCTNQDFKVIKAMHKYIEQNQHAEYFSDTPLKGKLFREICNAQMPHPIYFAIEILRSANGVFVPYSQLKHEWDRRPNAAKDYKFLAFELLRKRIESYLDIGEKLETTPEKDLKISCE
ncbi:MAG: hypothetical protein IPJ03_16590 [Ignavibacteriales bacterium]|nr:hypothetical protein [Ignavibacteriales bacterium]